MTKNELILALSDVEPDAHVYVAVFFPKTAAVLEITHVSPNGQLNVPFVGVEHGPYAGVEGHCPTCIARIDAEQEKGNKPS